MRSWKATAQGLATRIPGAYRLFSRTGGSDSARYCYAIWLRHLVLAVEHGLTTTVPRVVAELGPGDSLGIGLAALLSGAEQYYALDRVPYATAQKNVQILDELVDLFRHRTDIPGHDELPLRNLRLQSYQFPSAILTDSQLERLLHPDRINAIRKALRGEASPNGHSISIAYLAHWYEPSVIAESSADMIYSQAVLEHVDDLDLTYRALSRWLKPKGFMSHAIDFDCHGTAARWNGHWAYSERAWKLIRGKRAYLINRQPHSTHLDMLYRNGFEIVCDRTRIDRTGIERAELAAEFKWMSDDDLVTRSALVQARKE